MKRIPKIMLTTIIVTILLVTNLPILAFANNLNDNTDKKSQDKDLGVIIMYKQKASEFETKRKSSNSKPGFLQNLMVENTIKFKSSNSSSTNTKMTKSIKSATTTQTSDDLTISLVKSEKYSNEEIIRMLSKEDSVIYAQKNYKVKSMSITNDTYQKYQWAIENLGQNNGKKGSDINPETINNQSSDEKVIVVLDSGVDYNHPDLKNKIWNNPYLKSGQLEGEHGYDFYDYDEDPMDENGHGTHVAGIIAAEANNNKGITGAVLDKSNIKIMPIRFTSPWGYGTSYDAIAAYHYIYTAQKLGTNIVAINNSWGGYSEKGDYILKTVIDLVGNGPKKDGRGAVSICAAGNEKINTDEYISTPAGLDSNYIISVAASNEKDELLSFSNYGKDTVDIAAPGTDILSTISYDCFNPSIYDNKKKEKICSQYESFDSGIGSLKFNASQGTVTTSSESYFGTSGKSLKWSFNATEGNFYFLAMKYTGEMPSQYLSVMTKAISDLEDIGYYNLIAYDDDYDKIDFEKIIQDDEEDYEYEYEYDYEDYKNKIPKVKILKNKISKESLVQDENSWTHIFGNVYEAAEGEEVKSIILFYYAFEDSNVSVYLDDYAVSNADCSEDFDQYEFFSGTSMATPYVTAAVGIASNIKDETAIRRKGRVLGSVRQVNNFKDKVATNGIIDYSKLKDPTPTVGSAKIDNNGKLTINTNNITNDTEILINNKKVELTKIGDNKFEIVDKSLKNKTVTISLKYDDNSISSEFYLAVGKELNYEDDIFDIKYMDNLFTDGKNIYVYENQTIYKYIYGVKDGFDFEYFDVGLDECTNDLLKGKDEVLEQILGIEDTSDFVVINDRIYTIVTFDSLVGKEYILAYYDMKSKDSVWNKLVELPEDCKLDMVTLGVYNGNLYIMGGYNEDEDMISKKMYEYNLKTKKWTKKANLPEERFGAKANQVGNKLILSFGGKSDGKVPCNLIFDGKTWKKSTASIDVKIYTGLVYDKKYYKPSAGIIAGGLIYSGINAEKYGNVFYYDIASDTFKGSGYMVENSECTMGVAVGDKYYLFDRNPEKNKLVLKSLPVKSGLAKLSVRYPSTGIRAWVNGNLYSKRKSDSVVYNTYYYMPGDIVGVKLTDIPGYYYNHFKVDGKEIDGYKYNDVMNADREIRITKAETANLIKIDKTSATITSFSAVKLNATSTDKNLPAIKWKSSDTKYAIVSSTGLVTPKWAGNGKTVTITATQTVNGRNVSVECKVKINTPTIQNLRATKATNSSISLIWDSVAGAEGYEIYQYNTKTKKYELFKIQKGNSVTISGLNASTMYNFRILAYKTKDNKKCTSTKATISVQTIK